jgi:hypothetical protein
MRLLTIGQLGAIRGTVLQNVSMLIDEERTVEKWWRRRESSLAGFRKQA